jgi:hypothetical protein
MVQAEQSLLQFGMQLMSRLDTAQVVIDLYIFAALACVWMHRENRAHGRTFAFLLSYFTLTATSTCSTPRRPSWTTCSRSASFFRCCAAAPAS